VLQRGKQRDLEEEVRMQHFPLSGRFSPFIALASRPLLGFNLNKIG
jgi:hypothetical protein